MEDARRLSIPGFSSRRSTTDFDGVILAPVKFDLLIQLAQLLVHAHAHEAFRRELLEELAELTLAPAHNGRQDHHAFAFAVAAVARLRAKP